MVRRTFAIAILIAIVVSLPVVYSQAPKAANNVQAEIERLHNQWFTAFDKGDGATMDRIEVPNLILINADGKGAIWQKPGPRAGKQKPTGESRTLSKAQVRQFGDVAILTGVLLSKGGPEIYTRSTTVVFVRQNNQWLIASAQWSDVPAENK